MATTPPSDIVTFKDEVTVQVEEILKDHLGNPLLDDKGEPLIGLVNKRYIVEREIERVVRNTTITPVRLP